VAGGIVRDRAGSEQNGVADGTDYNKDRSVSSLVQYATAKIGGDEKALRRSVSHNASHKSPLSLVLV